MYTIDKNMSLGPATLIVKDLRLMKDFYLDKVGLTELNKTSQTIVLGVKNRPLIILKERTEESSSEQKAGLFHTAFLLPERSDLGNILYKLLTEETPVSGASDHGYSEAIYLQDPEGNGIEIYRDKPKEKWTIQSDGRIPGVTKEMDGEGVLNSRKNDTTQQMPEGTVIGHMHLSVRNLDETQQFYSDVLGMSLKDYFGSQARFLAGGGYHHHIGSNTWAGSGLTVRNKEDLGLQSLTIHLSSAEKINELRTHLETNQIEFNEIEEAIELKDPNGIIVRITVE
ncbi:VOC family protein [Alkalibacterium sp.]